MTTLYRLVGANREPLYIGITDNYATRIRDHSEKSWFSEVRLIETEEYSTRQEAKAAETLAIQIHRPRFNRAENPDRVKAMRQLPPRNPSQDRELITLEQAAGYLQVSVKTVRRRIADGSLRAYKFGPRMVRVDKADIEATLATLNAWAWKEPRR